MEHTNSSSTLKFQMAENKVGVYKQPLKVV